tara:strand:- start:69519 stop:69938 length:420 start_codon:yes stop_codon:yes gene_type:complete
METYTSLKLAMDDALDEVLDSISETVQIAVGEGTEFAIDDSPVDTGRFKANWYAVIDHEGSDREYDVYDVEGSSTLATARSEIDKYDAHTDDFIYIYNNVSDGEEDYAQTVSYDPTGGVAGDIMEQMETLVDSLLIEAD